MSNEVMVIRDPEVAKLLADDTRRRILSLLRLAEMTPQQLAKFLNKNVSSIMHHLTMLEQGGLVSVTRTEVRRNLVVKWYRAQARRFIVSYELAEGLVPGSEDYALKLEEKAKGAAAILARMTLGLNEAQAIELAELIRKLHVLWIEAFERALSKSPKEGDPSINDMVVKALTAANLYRKPEYFTILKRLNELLGETIG